MVTVVLGSFFFLGGIDKTEAAILSPARIEISGDPGQTINGKLNLINNQDEAKTFYSSAENFEPQDETGTPQFVKSEGELSSWVKIQESVQLASGERKEIPFSVTIPDDAGVGGHFAAIFWGINPPKASDGRINVAIGAKVGSLVFLTVNGEIVTRGEIIEFGSFSKKNFFTSLPVDMVFRFENSGNDRVKPIGEIKIVNLFGKTAETIPVNKKYASVLPESVRKFYASWGRENIEEIENKAPEQVKDITMPFWTRVRAQAADFHLGKYTVELNLKYGPRNEKEAKKNYAFYVFPWEIISLIAILLIILLLGGKLLIRRYNRWILSKARVNGERL